MLQFWQIQTALAQIQNSRVSLDQAPVAFTESDLGEDGQAIPVQFQQALPGAERVVAVAVPECRPC